MAWQLTDTRKYFYILYIVSQLNIHSSISALILKVIQKFKYGRIQFNARFFHQYFLCLFLSSRVLKNICQTSDNFNIVISICEHPVKFLFERFLDQFLNIWSSKAVFITLNKLDLIIIRWQDFVKKSPFLERIWCHR